ncbi:retrovirus-related pol polyprotein from transposon TNT 1-94 [Tanacetum coccineum]
MSINHEKYTLVIVDEYLKYTWVHFLRKKSQAPEMIMSFIRMLESFCDEKGISQNFSSPYTHEQNGVSERKNRTLIEAARTMLNGSVLFKHLWTEAVRIASNDGYFLGYFVVSKAFRVFNIRRQQIDETYHVIFDECMEAIRFTNTPVHEIRTDDSSIYPLDEFLHEDDPSRQYQVDSDVSYYIIPHGRSLTELNQENHVPEVIALNEPDIPLTEDNEGPPDLINTEGTHEQNVQNEQITTQPTEGPSGNNIEVLVSIIKSLVPNVPQSQISNQASTSMLTRSMAAKLTATSASECLFADFLSEIEPKKVSEPLGHPNSEEEEMTRMKPLLLVVRMEAIRIFFAFATYMNFIVLQMDVKSAFLNGKLKEEVYVKQPLGFESSEFPDYVCKLDKALYGLKQTPKACLDNISSISQQRSKLDSTCDHLVFDILPLSFFFQNYKKMASNQAIKYAPQCGDLTVKSLNFDNNNVVGNFSYPQTAPAYHDICKYLMNCLLAEAFTKTPLVVYQNLLREFWCIAIAYDPNPPINNSEARPLKEYLINFSVMNVKKPLILYYKTFVESTRLDYAKGTYVSHPSPEAVKAELAKIVERQNCLSCGLEDSVHFCCSGPRLELLLH